MYTTKGMKKKLEPGVPRNSSSSAAAILGESALRRHKKKTKERGGLQARKFGGGRTVGSPCSDVSGDIDVGGEGSYGQ